MDTLDINFFNNNTVKVAKSLLGHSLLFKKNNILTGGIINEVEAYTQNDPASHSYIGKTNRNKAMFESYGTIYIYKIYGMYTCINIVTEQKDKGCAVLIRSIIPTHNINEIKINRNNKKHLTNGPAKITQALDIPFELNGKIINKSNLLISKNKIKPKNIISTPRIGISKAINKKWRFYFNLLI